MMGFGENTVRFIHRLKLAHHTSGVGARGGFLVAYRPTLPNPRETLVAEILAIVREVTLRNEDRNGAIGYLRVGVGCTHDAVDIADHDRFDLKRAEFTVTATGLIVSVGFDLDKRG